MRFSVIVMPLLAALALAAPAPVDAEARQIDKRTLDDALADIDLALADLLALDVDGAIAALEAALEDLDAP